MTIYILNRNAYKTKDIRPEPAQTLKKRNVPWLCLGLSAVLSLLTLLAMICKLQSEIFIYQINIDTHSTEPLHVVNEKFLSLGLDSSVITDGFEYFNMSDPKLITMMNYLSPAYLRIGGNAADQILFCGEVNNKNCRISNESDTFMLKDTDWVKLHTLGSMAQLNIIYDLNSLLRYKNGSWNSKNAEEMISFSQKQQLKLDWELGNEPNSYEHKFGKNVSATQLGMDYISLRSILNKYELYKNSLLVGPSTTRLRTKDIQRYFSDFLISGSKAVSAITWHHYYFSGINATADEFLNPHIFNYLKHHIKLVKSIVKRTLPNPPPIWLGETSSAWHSGAPHLSDRFIASFIWIDKLGLSAKMGIDVVVRQSIFKGHYALLNDTYDPNPDWWLSLMYNKLVSTTVVRSVVNDDVNNDKIRLYAHCAKNSFLEDQKLKSPVVVFGLNIRDDTGFVEMNKFEASDTVYVYEFTAGDLLFSKFIRLNGQILKMLPNLKLPDMKPKVIKRVKVLEMPPYSIIFWVFTNTNVTVCLK